ncbi:hypothetical protein O5D80_002236 [Batrachochytrium dendrobatidis]|nr:hypothetical protein O5D80_002236 [Batrachochytrium dendrobatidis]
MKLPTLWKKKSKLVNTAAGESEPHSTHIDSQICSNCSVDNDYAHHHPCHHKNHCPHTMPQSPSPTKTPIVHSNSPRRTLYSEYDDLECFTKHPCLGEVQTTSHSNLSSRLHSLPHSPISYCGSCSQTQPFVLLQKPITCSCVATLVDLNDQVIDIGPSDSACSIAASNPSIQTNILGSDLKSTNLIQGPLSQADEKSEIWNGQVLSFKSTDTDVLSYRLCDHTTVTLSRQFSMNQTKSVRSTPDLISSPKHSNVQHWCNQDSDDNFYAKSNDTAVDPPVQSNHTFISRRKSFFKGLLDSNTEPKRTVRPKLNSEPKPSRWTLADDQKVKDVGNDLNFKKATKTTESSIPKPTSKIANSLFQWSKNPFSWLKSHSSWWQANSTRSPFCANTGPAPTKVYKSSFSSTQQDPLPDTQPSTPFCDVAEEVNTDSHKLSHHTSSMVQPIPARNYEHGLHVPSIGTTPRNNLSNTESRSHHQFVGFNQKTSVLEMMEQLADNQSMNEKKLRRGSFQSKGAEIIAKSGLAGFAASAMAAAAATATATASR